MRKVSFTLVPLFLRVSQCFVPWFNFQSQQVFGDIPATETSNDKLGAVASENVLCSQIGIDLLRAGGSAADAVRLLCIVRLQS